jgi:hypothetical protein
MKKERAKRPSKLDVFITTVVQDWTHKSTEEIMRRRDILLSEANAVDGEIHGLSAKLIDARARQQKIEASLNALAMVVEKR